MLRFNTWPLEPGHVEFTTSGPVPRVVETIRRINETGGESRGFRQVLHTYGGAVGSLLVANVADYSKITAIVQDLANTLPEGEIREEFLSGFSFGTLGTYERFSFSERDANEGDAR